MPTQSTGLGSAQHRLFCVMAVLLGIGWLNVPGDLTNAEHAETVLVTDTQYGAETQLGDPLRRFTFDSRELWKFRLTTRR